MAEYLSAGVYVEEVATAPQVTPGVTTSNMGIVGYAARGPSNVATLVQSFEQYSRTFGGLVKESRMGLTMAAFFANGGRRAYVVRVPPSDAIAANAKIQSDTMNDSVAVGDGVATAFTGTIDTAAGAAPIVVGSAKLEWREEGVPFAPANARNADDTADLQLVPGQASYDGRIDPANLPSFDPRFDSAVRGTVTVNFTVGASSGGPTQSITLPVTDSPIASAAAGDGTNGAYVTLDHRSGRFSLRTFGNFVPAMGDVNAITVDHTPATETKAMYDARGYIQSVDGATLATPGGPYTVTVADGTNTAVFTFDSTGTAPAPTIPFTATDSAETVRDAIIAAINAYSPLLLKAAALSGFTDLIRLLPNSSTAPGSVQVTSNACTTGPLSATSSGVWAGDTSADGSVDYAGGDISFETSGAPHVKASVLASYTRNAWSLSPISVGAWGNELKVQMAGSPNYFTAATGSYSRYDFNVLLLNSATGNYDVVEQYEELDFTNPSSSVYFADVLNELSDYITVAEPAGDEAPGQLNAVAYSMVIGGGSDTTANKSFSLTLAEAPLQPRTLVISYTDAGGVTRAVRDNGNGVLVGDVSSSTTNTVDYETGALSFTTTYNIKGGTLVVASYSAEVVENVHTESFGNVLKQYVVGTEGTFASPYWGREQFTDLTALAANYEGMYAFNKVEEILQVVIPDFAGNTLISSDQLDYAALRTSQPHGGDRFIILTTPSGYSAQDAVDWYRFTLGRNSDYAALYWPWVRVADPLNNNRPTLFPPLGHVAGVYARTDSTKNVGKSPGGTVDGALTYLTGLETVTTLADRDVVYPNKINPLISGVQTGLAVWGVRTISNVPDWRYINARRLFMFLEKSVYNSTWWAVFENNGPALWAKISSQINSFLSNLFSQGYFAGANPSQAYFVVCDASNNTAATIEAGQLVIDIGVAPNKPAEFIRLRFQQKSLNS